MRKRLKVHLVCGIVGACAILVAVWLGTTLADVFIHANDWLLLTLRKPLVQIIYLALFGFCVGVFISITVSKKEERI